MQTIILRPYDDNEIVETYLVEHNTTPKKDFVKPFEQTLEAVKKEQPEDWCLDQVFKALEKKGWQIFRTSATTLTY